ncbi:PREDICTED: estradiol 17-beta-dehydrogenase 2 [Chrysochloris asiatica]|uniref:Estradiol 17-beta-dehydrogenase 2 n=1 Tax=Chrysochloris asiatica TaxID=185453 RepID=A0A9B0TH71_CHRAS|nr:PREDICTED: estradiol 17-beta-dehydrogenase 2 [Chrysochloris asiatica]
MGIVFSEVAAWLYLAVTVALGGTVLCKLEKSPRQVGRGPSYLVGLWGAACLLSLPFYYGVTLFFLSCSLLYSYLAGQELLPVHHKAVLITGCDTGIGHVLSKYLDELGFTVFAGVLNEKGPGAEELRRSCSSRLCVIQLDVTNSTQIREAYSKVLEKVQDRGLWAVINNAGILGFPADGELIPMSDYRQCMAVNFLGAVEVTKTLLPFLRRSKGRLVNVCSMAAGVPLQKLAAYSSSKAALMMFSGVLRQELSKWGVKVIIIQPGAFKTNIAGTNEMWNKLEKNLLDALDPEVQKDYGRDYVLALRNFVRSLPLMCSSDFSPLLLDISHAVSAKSPFAVYTPGKGCYLWICLASFLPASVFDFLKKIELGFFKKMKNGKHTALQK